MLHLVKKCSEPIESPIVAHEAGETGRDRVDDADRTGASGAAMPATTSILAEQLYDEMRQIAGALMRRESRNHTLQPTALVHEAVLRLANGPSRHPMTANEYLALAATVMRHVLVNHAVRRRALKRGGDQQRVMMDAAGIAAPSENPTQVDVEEVDMCLRRLAGMDERKARVVELRYFAGMTMEQIADLLGMSLSTVENDWRVARAWMASELFRSTRGDGR